MGFKECEVTILVDNSASPPLKEAWGLSILATCDNLKILWDTGPDPSVLKHNAKILKKDLKVDLLVFSHRHWDHTGGYSAVEAKEVIAPEDPFFPIKNVTFNNNYTRIVDGVIVTKPMHAFNIREQALILSVDGYGYAMLVGCSHPGVDNMYEAVVRDLGIRPRMVIGGFHLFGQPKRKVEEVISNLKRLGAKELHPIHCSGSYAKLLARSHVEAGSVLRLS